MKRALAPLILAACLVTAPALAASPATPGPRVLVIDFATDVNPVTQGWLNSQLGRAVSGHFAAAVIVLDTPGGYEDSMELIVQKELATSAAGVPVVVYVSPEGAHAASAGVWIGEAADVLAMAPETNIGSSTPISSTGANIGSDLRRKVINDAAASLRGLAASHDRNARWANQAVRVAANLTDEEALKQHVVDLVAPSLPALLDEINGRTTVPDHLRLHTAGATIVTVKPGVLVGFLSGLLDPNVVSLLFLAGIVGLGFELFHPGVILPGVIGAVSLVLSLFGLSVLSVSTTGLLLVVVGVALLAIDLRATSHGVLTLGGLAALALGLASLFPNAPAPYHSSTVLIVGLTLLVGGLWAIVAGKAIAARRLPVSVGPHEILGKHGIVDEKGLVFVNGELWQARSDEPLRPGQRVQVDALDGLTLRVHRVGA